VHASGPPSELRRRSESRLRAPLRKFSRVVRRRLHRRRRATVPPEQTVIPGNDAQLLRDGPEVLPRMLEDIRNARRSIDIEMYCFADDFVGCRFARALAERAEQGVDVRVLVDAAGCRRTPRSFFGWMRERGIRVRGVNPLRRFLLQGSLFRWRDHRKLVVVDGSSAYVGGLNLSRDYAAASEGGCGWRDAAIRLTGPVVPVLRASFERQWKDVTAVGSRPSPSRGETLEPPAPTGDVPAIVLESRPIGPGPFASVFRRAVEGARERIWIANPYFLPPRSLRRALRRAARRGADVRVLLRGLERLGFHTPGISSHLSVQATDAIVAFQKAYRLPRTYVFDGDDWRRFAKARRIRPRFKRPRLHIEMYKARQILMVVKRGRVVHILPTSTGATGNTPLGLWHVYAKRTGWDWVLWYPSYFLRGFAIHGYPSVPAYPASHGCVRVPMWIATTIYAGHGLGTTVYVY